MNKQFSFHPAEPGFEERATVALESIARSLEKLANPAVIVTPEPKRAVNPDAYVLNGKRVIQIMERNCAGCAFQVHGCPAQSDEIAVFGRPCTADNAAYQYREVT